MTNPENPYFKQFRGSFSGVLRWPQLDELWQYLREDHAHNWYVYVVGETPPVTPVTPPQLVQFIDDLDALLHKEHEQDYCGIVYVDDFESATMVKIFDPNNLGVSCGYSDNPPLPGWILSLIPPIDLPKAMLPPENRWYGWARKIWSK